VSNPVVSIRLSEPQDADGVRALWESVFGYSQFRNAPERVLKALVEWKTTILVACEGDAVVGTLVVGYDGHRGWLYRLAVAPGLRRRGIATSLVREGESVLRRLGCAKVNLQILDVNHDAQNCWTTLGYRSEPRISMGKDLLESPD
jgi:predicted N-acetyltransferase YhbS